MGITLGFSDDPKPTFARRIRKYVFDPNPDPFKFTIKETEIVGDCVVVLVHYPNCTTYNGNKILVYTHQDWKTWLCSGTQELDPHFLEGKISPIARFPANDEGEKQAKVFAKALFEHERSLI